jgi:uncharacterized protein (UPF0333 family)
MKPIAPMRTSRIHPSSKKRRRGAAVVEFALVVPLVLMLAFAAIEFARVIMIRHSADNAVYESARLAIIPGGSAADARAESARLLSLIGINDFLVEVIPPVLTPDTRDVTVRVAIPMNTNSYFPAQFFAGRTIRRELTLRREGL